MVGCWQTDLPSTLIPISKSRRNPGEAQRESAGYASGRRALRAQLRRAVGVPGARLLSGAIPPPLPKEGLEALAVPLPNFETPVLLMKRTSLTDDEHHFSKVDMHLPAPKRDMDLVKRFPMSFSVFSFPSIPYPFFTQIRHST